MASGRAQRFRQYDYDGKSPQCGLESACECMSGMFVHTSDDVEGEGAPLGARRRGDIIMRESAKMLNWEGGLLHRRFDHADLSSKYSPTRPTTLVQCSPSLVLKGLETAPFVAEREGRFGVRSRTKASAPKL